MREPMIIHMAVEMKSNLRYFPCELTSDDGERGWYIVHVMKGFYLAEPIEGKWTVRWWKLKSLFSGMSQNMNEPWGAV